MKGLSVLLAIMVMVTPFVVCLDAEAAIGKRRQFGPEDAVRRTLLRAVASRELRVRDAWRALRLLKRDPAFRDQVVEFVTVGAREDGLKLPAAGAPEADWQSFIQWLWENREAILEFILVLISLFSFDLTPLPAGLCAAPPPTLLLAA